jgi:hypothetical protein
MPTPPSSSSATPPPPADGDRIILDALTALELLTDMEPPLFDGHAVADLALSAPLPVYTTGLSDLQSGKLTEAAEATHWRYLLTTTLPSKPLAVVDLAFLDKAWVIAGINRGVVADATSETVEFAANQPEWRSGTYEPRLLQVPALYTLMVWFHDLSEAAGDVFIPIVDPDGAFKPQIMIDEPTALRTLQGIASHYKPAP